MRRREFLGVLGDANFLVCSAARRSCGPLLRARSRRRKCRSSGYLPPARPHPTANGSPRWCGGCVSSAGSRAAPSRSSTAGPKVRRALWRNRSRVRPTQGRCHWHDGSRVIRSKIGDIDHPDRLRDSGGPGGHGPGCQSRAAGRQHHRFVAPADRCGSQAPRTLARDHSRSSPVGDYGQCRRSRCRAGRSRGPGWRARLVSMLSSWKSGASDAICCGA